jgi:hypothetical protein
MDERIKSEGNIRCYRCGGQTRPLPSVDGEREIGTILVHLACSSCGQEYELQYTLAAVFATAPGGEALALLRHCQRCNQLYLDQDEPHVCREREDEMGGTGT